MQILSFMVIFLFSGSMLATGFAEELKIQIPPEKVFLEFWYNSKLEGFEPEALLFNCEKEIHLSQLYSLIKKIKIPSISLRRAAREQPSCITNSEKELLIIKFILNYNDLRSK